MGDVPNINFRDYDTSQEHASLQICEFIYVGLEQLV